MQTVNRIDSAPRMAECSANSSLQSEYERNMTSYPPSVIEGIMKEPLYEISLPNSMVDGMVSSSSFQWTTTTEDGADQDDGTDEMSQMPYNSLVRDVAEVGSAVDRALEFVLEVKQLHEGLDEEFKGLWDSVHSFNQLFDLVERLILAQADFKASGKRVSIDVGYHYTTELNLPNIQQQGLLTKADREALGIHSRFNGSMHGDGVYLGNNPFAFAGGAYGKVGLLVARLRGNEVASRHQRHWDGGQDADTKTSNEGFQQMVILRSSKQCVPLLAFELSALDFDNDAALGNEKVYNLHVCLQNLLDRHFNDCPTQVTRVLPSESPGQRRRMNRLKRRQTRMVRQTNNKRQRPASVASPCSSPVAVPAAAAQQTAIAAPFKPMVVPTGPAAVAPAASPRLSNCVSCTQPTVGTGMAAQAPHSHQQSVVSTGDSLSGTLPQLSPPQALQSQSTQTVAVGANATQSCLYSDTINGGSLGKDVIDILLNINSAA